MSKPKVTLTQLEEEPETGFFGLTFTEVKKVFIYSFLVIVFMAVLFSFFLSFDIATIIGVFIGIAFFWFYIKKSARNRADKPLYYHRHLRTYKNPKVFIQPQKHYQRERNCYDAKK